MTAPSADRSASAEALLQDLQPEDASLARSVRARVLALGTVIERLASRELVFALATEGGVEVARLQLKAGATPRIAFPTDACLAPIEITGLHAAVNAAEAVRVRAEAVAAAAPQLNLFGSNP